MEGRRTELRGKYVQLGTGELVAAAVFAAVAGLLITPRIDPGAVPALWSALTPLLVILVQGGLYWLIARTWVAASPMPAAAAGAYRVFRVADPVLLAIGLGGIVLWWPEPLPVALLIILVWAFGVIEYVNYFVVRLAYPFRRWFSEVTRWRTPRLVQDLRSART